MPSTFLHQQSVDLLSCKYFTAVTEETNNFFSSQQEYVVVLCWVMWCGIHILAMVILSIMSCFTVLPNIPARLILHIVCGLFSLLGGLVMLRVYSRRYARDPAPSRHNNYDWRQDRGAMEAGAGGVHNMDLSKESNVL